MMQFSTLIDSTELAARVAREDWVVLDCRFALDDPEAGRLRYLEGHIPGAQHADLERDLSDPEISGVSGRHPLPRRDALSRKFRVWGVNPDSQLVAYDAGNGAFAARLWWLARWLGHRAVAVLDGGFEAWREAGLPVDKAPVAPRPQGRFRAGRALTQVVDARAVLDALNSSTIIVDARARERYRGEVEPIDPVAGHIPGAHCAPFDENLDARGRWLSPASLARRFADLQAAQAICYCGSGVTATHDILAVVHAGLPEPALYPGSWSEWIQDPDRPIARGND